MNKETLTQLFNNSLVGQVIPNGYYWNKERPILNLVREQLKKEGIDEKIINNIKVSHDNRGNGFSVMYRDVTLAYFKYTRVKGDYMRYIGQEWNFSHFECLTPDFELIQRVEEINDKYDEREKQSNEELQKMVRAYKKIKKLFGDKTDQIIGYLHKNGYSVREQLEKEQ